MISFGIFDLSIDNITSPKKKGKKKRSKKQKE